MMNDSYLSISSKSWSESIAFYIKPNCRRILPMAKCAFAALSSVYSGLSQYRTCRCLKRLRSKETIDPESEYRLAKCYHYGTDVTADISKAFQGYERAAKAGHVLAQYNLARFYHLGIGVEQDESLASHWFLKAAEGGHAESQYIFAERCYTGCGGVKVNDSEVIYWYKKAAEAGHMEAQYRAGFYYHKLHYYDSINVEENRKEAFKWFKRAAEAGHIAAQSYLADYEKIEEFQDLKEASKWPNLVEERLQVKADKGDPELLEEQLQVNLV